MTVQAVNSDGTVLADLTGKSKLEVPANTNFTLEYNFDDTVLNTPAGAPTTPQTAVTGTISIIGNVSPVANVVAVSAS